MSILVKRNRKKGRRTTGGVSYRAYAQMLSQTILGTECSLSHSQKTSYLPWQQQSGKKDKRKEREDKEKHTLQQITMPY